MIKNIVLVHGAFADGSSWNKVIRLLQAKDYQTLHAPRARNTDFAAGARPSITATTFSAV